MTYRDSVNLLICLGMFNIGFWDKRIEKYNNHLERSDKVFEFFSKNRKYSFKMGDSVVNFLYRSHDYGNGNTYEELDMDIEGKWFNIGLIDYHFEKNQNINKGHLDIRTNINYEKGQELLTEIYDALEDSLGL